VEGEIRAEGDSIGDLAMSPDASRIAYTRAPEARRDAGRGRGDGRRGRRGSRGARRVVVVDGEAGREWDAVEHLQFSADGRAVAFVGVVDRVHYPIVDGREWPGFRRLENATFAPAGRRFAAWGTDADNEGTQLVVDGTTYTTDGDLLAFTFSEDGMHDAHAVKVGKVGQRQRVFRNNELLCETVGLDSQPIEPGRGPTSDRRVRGDGTRWTLWLSPEGRRLLHTTRDGIFVDGEPMIEYDDTIRHLRGLTATRGFEHVAGHRSARDRSFVLLDGRITPFCDAVYPVHFLPDGALTAVVEKDGEFRRFTSRP